MCRSIKPLFHLEPPPTAEDIEAAALQFVRKISGYSKPSLTNEAAFSKAVEEITQAATVLLQELKTKAPPRLRVHRTGTETTTRLS